MDNPTFAERTAAMRQAAEQLQACSDIVRAEFERMETAAKRFAQRVGRGTGSRQRNAPLIDPDRP